MTQAQLDHEVAAATGESARTLTRLGFSTPPGGHAGTDPGALYLVVDCPHCGGAALFPGQRPDGSYSMARCPGCEAVFGFDVLDVYVAASLNG